MKNHMKNFDMFKSLNENTSDTFIFPNQPNEKVEKSKEWVRNNPHLARRPASDSDNFEIEVFSYGNKRELADELYSVLKDSGFLDKHPLFSIRIDPM